MNRIRLTAASIICLLFCCGGAASAQTNRTFEIVPGIPHDSFLRVVAFSPDGGMALSGSDDRTVKLWDVKSRRLLRTFANTDAGSAAFSPDGRTILTGGLDLWDVSSGKLVHKFAEGGQDFVVAFSPDGRTAVSGGGTENTMRLWDVDKGDLIRKFVGENPRSVNFSPDGSTVISTSGADIKVFQTSTGKLLRRFADRSGEFIYSIAVSPDGMTVLSGGKPSVKLWDLASGKLLKTFHGNSSDVNAVAFTPDGQHAVSGGSDEKIRVWDVASSRLIQTFTPEPSVTSLAVNSLAVSPDGRKVLSGDHSPPALWDLTSGQQEAFLAPALACSSISSAPVLRSALIGCDDGTLRLWDLATGRPLSQFQLPPGAPSPITATAFSLDGTMVLAGRKDGWVLAWDVASGQGLRAFVSQDHPVATLGFLPEGEVLSAGISEATLKVWSLKTGQLARELSKRDWKFYRTWVSPDGSKAFTQSTPAMSGSAFDLWDLKSGKIVSTSTKAVTGSTLSVVFAPGNKTVLMGGWDRFLKLWDLHSDKQVVTFDAPGQPTYSVALSADGRRALSGSEDHTLKYWDASNGKLLRTLDGHLGSVTAVALSSDPRMALSTSRDQTIKLWNVESGELLLSIIAFDNGEWVSITPEGFFEASDNGARDLNLVRGVEMLSIDQVYDALHRPDLVQQKLAGDPQGLVRAAAASLDLTKVASSGGPPTVKITTAPTSVSDAQVVIEATVRDQGGGIGRIEWRNNKKTLEIDATSTASGEKSKTVVVRKTVPLVVGDNVIEIKAYNGLNLIESEAVQVTVTRTRQPQAQTTRPQLYVLAVGVNDYWDSKLHLNFAVPDAISMAEALQQAGSKLYERVNITTVLNADVNAAKLDRIFADLKGKVKAEDVFVFFLSGHGKTEGGKFYYIPQDFRYNGTESIVQNAISHDKLKGWLGQILAQKSVLLFDACESGALIQGQIAMRGLEDKTALDHLVRATGATVLTATTDDKPAAEGYYGHGVFTYALLSAFANADANGDGFIDVQELASYVFAKVPALTDAAWGIKQSPQFNVVGSIYPLVAKTSLLPVTAAGPPAAIPAISTHVVIAASTVRLSASAASGVVIELKPGTQVRLMEISGAWILVARDGKKLGYIDAKSVAGLQ